MEHQTAQSLGIDDLGDLLDVLCKRGVETFSGFGIQVTFRSDFAPDTGDVIKTDDATSNRPVQGFKSNFHNPAAWPGMNGKLLRFDGTYEE